MTLQTDGQTDGLGVLQYPRFFFEKRGDNDIRQDIVYNVSL